MPNPAIDLNTLYIAPNALAKKYSLFQVEQRLLLTGHSHQAWPDCAREGQIEAYEDAACYVDEKWERAFSKAELVKIGFAKLLNDKPSHIALGQNTHELVARFLSGLDWRKNRRLVTTDGEFHTIRRQLDRLGEEGVEIVKCASSPISQCADRVIEAINEKTTAVLISAVCYDRGLYIPYLNSVSEACDRYDIPLLIDVYHALNVIPFALDALGLERAYVVGGGYKYCQLGEGNCFLRIPPQCHMRPVLTGWFAEFSVLASESQNNHVIYGPGAERFGGSTYDPTSHYRAAKVFEFMHNQGLTPEVLRTVNKHQVELLIRCFDQIGADQSLIYRNDTVSMDQRGGFLVLFSSQAAKFYRNLRKLGVWTDARGDHLRFGPAPYLNDHQLITAMDMLAEVIKKN